MKYPQLIQFIKKEINERNWEKETIIYDEINILKDFKNHVERRLEIPIEINSKFDPNNKANKAIPNKPALYFEY